MKGWIFLMHYKNCTCQKCLTNKSKCYKLLGNLEGQIVIKSIPYSESLLISPAPGDKLGYGYRFDPGPIISPASINEIPLQSIGLLSNVEAIQNGLHVQAGDYEIIAQVTIDYFGAFLLGNFAIAVNGVPLDTTTFITTSTVPSSSTVTIQSLNANDVITLVALNPAADLRVTTGSLTIKRLN